MLLSHTVLTAWRKRRKSASLSVAEDHPVLEALLDDLNTSEAISALHGIAARLNKAEPADKPALKAELLAGAGLLGLLDADPTGWFQNKKAGDDDLDAATIDDLVAQRTQAKKDRNFARADEIRDQLKDAGIQLEDTREGTRWTRG